jgi:cyclase
MSLKHRIITTLLFDETMQAVKPISFQRPYRRLGTLMQYIKVLDRRNIDELILIDITATEQKREPNYEKLREFTSNCFMPVTYGGGIRTLDSIRMALESGADKVCIKTSEQLIDKAAQKFGTQAIVYCLETNDEDMFKDVISKAKEIEEKGAGEILLVDRDYDGTMRGYELDFLQELVREIKIPIIACGGGSEPADMEYALKNGASAVAAGSMFLFTEHTPRSCAKYLHERGYAVRL